MAQIIQNITLEVSKPNFFQAIVAKQFDSDSRYLKVTLVNGAEKINILQTSTVTINAKRNDGAENLFKGEVNEDGTATVPLTYWMLELSGKLECDVSVIDADNRKLSSTKFDVEVERASCADPDVTDADKYDILILQGRNIVGSINGKTGDVDIGAADVGAVSIDEFNSHNHDTAYVKSKDIKDYIVEQGTSGDWTYRKWDSGIAECWQCTRIMFSNKAPTSIDGLSVLTQNVDLPFLFVKQQPVANCTCSWHWEEWAACCVPIVSGAYSIMQLRVFEPTEYADRAFEEGIIVHMEIKGRWK